MCSWCRHNKLVPLETKAVPWPSLGIAVRTLRDSLQDGFMQAFSGSCCTMSTRRWNSRSTQSMMRMMRCGGFPSFRTVAMSAGLMVLSAASASSRAGRAASNFSSAMAWKDILSSCNHFLWASYATVLAFAWCYRWVFCLMMTWNPLQENSIQPKFKCSANI